MCRVCSAVSFTACTYDPYIICFINIFYGTYITLYTRLHTRRLLSLLEEKHAKDMAGYNLHMSRLRGKNSPVPPDLKEPKHVSLYFPPLSLCTDNGMRQHFYDTVVMATLYMASYDWRICLTCYICTGAMVAYTAIEKLKLGISDEVEGQEAVARWPLGAVYGE